MDKQPVTIYKIGGTIIDELAELTLFLELFAQQASPKLLVHGGGQGASALLRALGHEPILRQGRRLTDARTLDVVTMYYAGKINKQLVAGLQRLGCDALGLSGADGNVIQGVKRAVGEVNYGFVGDVGSGSVRAGLLETLLTVGITPVLCPIIHDGQGQLLNTNADTIAAAVALALAPAYAVTLHYCFEKNGVLRNVNDEQSVIPKISLADYAELRQQGLINAGMLPKLDNAFAALAQGVEQVIIGHALRIGTELHTVLCPN